MCTHASCSLFGSSPVTLNSKAVDWIKKYNKDTNYKPTPEQKKEYNRQSYLKRKEKLKKEMEEKSNNENI